ncbi:hypothetical protein M0R45_011600 [Rubus argutus]|uniref:Uncharacterized protein n=1 Tax=Rubus argutus TaxID=59490 RepID=A0AAW1YEI3_RUBAR
MKVMSFTFAITSNPAEGLFFPLRRRTDCTCNGSGVERVCTCLPYLFLMFESAMAGAFTIVALVILRMSRDYKLYWWIFTALGFITFAFAICVFAATPWQYRQLVLIVDVVTALPLCLLLVRYWRNVWAFLKLSYYTLAGVWVSLVGIILLGWNLLTFRQKLKQIGQGMNVLWMRGSTTGTSS